MSSPAAPFDWLHRARLRADVAPLRTRAPLDVEVEIEGGVAQRRVGSVEPEIGLRLCAAGLPVRPRDDGFCFGAPASATLTAIARWLHEQRYAAHWRDELLAVTDEDGRALGAIERGVVRVLGLATEAVHLDGRAAGGGTWVQLRSTSKSTDPGLWDTLMGGQVAAGESVTDTLARETLEEAGLAIGTLGELVRHAPLRLRRPVREGYLVERIEVFSAVVPDGVEPLNRDGEVERFERLDDAALVERLARGEFTLEATLILGAELERRAGVGAGRP